MLVTRYHPGCDSAVAWRDPTSCPRSMPKGPFPPVRAGSAWTKESLLLPP